MRAIAEPAESSSPPAAGIPTMSNTVPGISILTVYHDVFFLHLDRRIGVAGITDIRIKREWTRSPPAQPGDLRLSLAAMFRMIATRSFGPQGFNEFQDVVVPEVAIREEAVDRVLDPVEDFEYCPHLRNHEQFHMPKT
jgi:hypothetical protein